MYVRMLALALALCASAFAQKGQYAVPEGAGIENFPILSGPLTVAQMVDMNLVPEKLLKPTVVENHFRGLRGKEGRWVLETLPIGTIVYRDALGRIEYKADCGNRIVEIDAPTGIATFSYPPVENKIAGGGQTGGSGPSMWQKFTDATKSLAKAIWEGIGNFLAPFGWLLLAFLGILLVLAILLAIANALRNWWNRRNNPPSAPPPATPAPTTPPGQPVTGSPAPSSSATGSPTEQAKSNPQDTLNSKGTAETDTTKDGEDFLHLKHEANQPHMARSRNLKSFHHQVSEDDIHTVRYAFHKK